MIKAITTNTNRSITNVKTAVQKYGGSLGAPGSVAWQFHHYGVIVIDGLSRIEMEKGNEVEYVDPYDRSRLEEDAFDCEIEDISFEDGLCIVSTSKDNYLTVDAEMRAKGYHIASSDLTYVPENTVSITDLEMESLDKIQAALDDDDDVDSVYSNVE